MAVYNYTLVVCCFLPVGVCLCVCVCSPPGINLYFILLLESLLFDARKE